MVRTTLLMLATLITTSTAWADWELNMPVGVTQISAETYDLHMLVLWICVVAGVLVFGTIIYALFKFRKSKGAVAATFDHSTTAEMIWTTIPVLVLVAMAIPAAQVAVKIEDDRNTEMTIKITGYQWKWHYEYVGENVGFYSNLAASSNAARRLESGIDPFEVDNYLLEVDKPLVVPVGVKIRYLITSNDVLHAWWVPELSVKKDAVPGYFNEGWFQIDETGIYRGQCAELCGKDHGFMPVVVEALSKEDYAAWLEERLEEKSS